MFLNSPDPDAFAIVHGDRRYPVRGGVFLIDPDIRGEFPSFEVAGEVAADVAAELAEAGSYPVEDAPVAAEPKAVAEPEAEHVEEADLSSEDEPEAEAAAEDEQAEEPAADEKPKPKRSRAKKA